MSYGNTISENSGSGEMLTTVVSKMSEPNGASPSQANVGDSSTKATYAYRRVVRHEPVQFPADAHEGTDIPKKLKRIGDLPHGDPVRCPMFTKAIFYIISKA